jgi:hypothetical protein
MVGTGNYPFRLVVAEHGKKAQTACGLLEAAYCPVDQTIAISADLALAATTESVNAIPWTAQTFLDIPEAIIHGNEGDVYEQHAIYG